MCATRRELLLVKLHTDERQVAERALESKVGKQPLDTEHSITPSDRRYRTVMVTAKERPSRAADTKMQEQQFP